MSDVFRLFAASIGHKFELIGVCEKASENNGSIGWFSIGTHGGKLGVAGVGKGAISV
jgi:hypothetical protein